jgi:hypothetical protein
VFGLGLWEVIVVVVVCDDDDSKTKVVLNSSFCYVRERRVRRERERGE